jgi:PAS domain S-box-containing protein
MIATLIALLVAAGAYILWEVAKASRARTQEQLQQTTRALSLLVDGEFARYESVIRTLTASPALAQGDWRSLDRMARAAVSGSEEWVVVSDRSGRQLVNTRLPRASALPSVPWRPATLAELDKGRLRVCPLSLGLVEKRILCLDQPVMKGSRAALVVSVVISPKHLERILARQQVPANRFASIVDQNGIVVWRNQEAERFVGQPISPLMLASLNAGREGLREGHSLDGVPAIIAHAKGTRGFSFLVAVPKAEVGAAQILSARWGLIFSALLIVAALAVAFLFGKRVSDAVQSLAAAAARLKSGRSPDAEKTSVPEIDDVGRALQEAFDRRRESDDRFSLAQEVGGVGAWDWDIPGDRGTVTRGYLKVHGLPETGEPLRLQEVIAVLHPDDRERYLTGLSENLKATGPVSDEYRVTHADGSVHWVAFKGHLIRDDAGTPLRSVGIVRDVTAERAAEAALVDSEERLRLATEGTGIGIYDLDLDEGRGRWSERAFEVLGLPVPHDRVGSFDLWRARLHPDDAERVAAAHAANAEGLTPWHIEYRIRRAGDGEVRWLETHGRFVRQPNGHVRSIGIVADVTERKQVALSLAESESRLRRSQEAGGIGSYEWDLTSGTGTQSEGMLAMVGLTPGKSYTLKEILAPVLQEDMAQVMATVEAINNGARKRETNYRIRHPKDGSIRWIRDIGQLEVDREGKPRRWVGIIQDVTERAIAEAELREEERRFRTLTNTVPAFVWLADPDGQLTYFNNRWYEYTGQTPESALPNGWTEMLHPDEREQIAQDWANALEQSRAYQVECRYRRRDGEYRWYIARAEPVCSDAGRVEEWFGTSSDIHDRKIAEMALTRLTETLEQQVQERTEQLRQSQKLESMGQLTGGVAHDFNNLLTPIIGSLDLLQRRGVGGEREQRMIDGALQSAERAKTLVQRLLAFARRQPLKPEPVDLANVVTGMADLIASTSGPKVSLSIDLEPNLPAVTADANQLELALLNLAVNARDAMPEGGQITISADVERVHEEHRSGLTTGRFVRLAVSDTGIGMDSETLARAIEPFFSTKGIGQGTGLGLSMVHGLASQLGGALRLDSRRGLGTTVEMWLPVTRARPTASRQIEGTNAPTLARTALLVDDDSFARASTAEMLAEMNYAVIEAENAEDALRLIQNGVGFDILITDHLMPGMNGTELARRILSFTPDKPVLIISGYAEVEGIAPELARLTKPFRQAELGQALASLRMADPATSGHSTATVARRPH